MKWYLCSANLAVLMLLLFAPALTVLAFAHGAGTPQDQNSSTSASQDAAKAETAVKIRYREYILTRGQDDEDYLAKLKSRKPREKPRESYAKSIGTSDEAEETIHSIILAAYKALRTNDAQCSKDIDDEQQRAYSPETYSKIQKLVEDRSKRELHIVEQAMAQLKEALTQEDFERLDWMVHLIGRIKN